MYWQNTASTTTAVPTINLRLVVNFIPPPPPPPPRPVLSDEVLLKRLELGPDADAAAIRRRFRVLAKKWHPDRNPDGTARMKELTEAYNELKRRGRLA
jgi:hypothetical protein